MLLSRRGVWLPPLVLGAAPAGAQAPSVEAELKPLIDRLARTASSQQFRQIIGATRASPQLTRQLGRLIAQRKLGEILIVAQKGSKPFGGWVDGTVICFTTDFLKVQAEYRGPSFHAGDMLPDNLVYCLGHLAYHLEMGVLNPARFPKLDNFVRKNLEIEAGAYIQGYNDVMDAAMQQNGGKPLTERQALPFLMNPWYRDALGQAKLTATGTIGLDAVNIGLVAATLRTLRMADLE